ncbi:transposase, partial [Roseospira marina]
HGASRLIQGSPLQNPFQARPLPRFLKCDSPAVLPHTPVLAQDAQSAADGVMVLEPVTVTARKRGEDEQDVPGSLPVRFELGPGQEYELAPACDLIRSLPAQKVLADRAYDADRLINQIEDQGAEAVILSRRHRKKQSETNWLSYKERWAIEGFFAKLKQWRRTATRYDKIAANFLGFVTLAAIMIWLK